MTTLLSSEWYKIRKSRLLGFILLGVTAQTLLFSLVPYVIRNRAVLERNGGAAANADSTMFFLLALWIAAFIGFFIASEFQTGTIRNPVALGKSRTHIYLSKLFSACVATAAIFIIFCIPYSRSRFPAAAAW
jgi:ABC-2 type transport system permease protein